MPTSLKTKNKLALAAIVIANFAIYWLLFNSTDLQAGDWKGLFQDIKKMIPAGVGLALIGILNAQLTPNAKARICFFRWNDPLPGCRAFSDLIHTDQRINVAALKKSLKKFPTSPSDQNAIWYKLFKTVEKEPSIQQAHQDFLFARDYATLALMIAITLGVSGFFQFEKTSIAWAYFGALVVQIFLAIRAAQTNGKGFVTTVLALKSAGR